MPGSLSCHRAPNRARPRAGSGTTGRSCLVLDRCPLIFQWPKGKAGQGWGIQDGGGSRGEYHSFSLTHPYSLSSPQGPHSALCLPPGPVGLPGPRGVVVDRALRVLLDQMGFLAAMVKQDSR